MCVVAGIQSQVRPIAFIAEGNSRNVVNVSYARCGGRAHENCTGGAAMKIKIKYARCRISVIGTEITCPLCDELVTSGETHTCTQEEKSSQEIVPEPKK